MWNILGGTITFVLIFLKITVPTQSDTEICSNIVLNRGHVQTTHVGQVWDIFDPSPHCLPLFYLPPSWESQDQQPNLNYSISYSATKKVSDEIVLYHYHTVQCLSDCQAYLLDIESWKMLRYREVYLRQMKLFRTTLGLHFFDHGLAKPPTCQTNK